MLEKDPMKRSEKREINYVKVEKITKHTVSLVTYTSKYINIKIYRASF